MYPNKGISQGPKGSSADWNLEKGWARGLDVEAGSQLVPGDPGEGRRVWGAELVPGVVPEAPPVSPAQIACGLADPQHGL